MAHYPVGKEVIFVLPWYRNKENDKNVFACTNVVHKQIGREKGLNTFQKMIRHPAGRIGLTIGVTLGFIAAIMGEGSKALLFAGLCRFLAGKFGR